MLINGSALNETTINVGLSVSEEETGTGADGKSAYDIWLELGNTGTQQDFIDSLKGEPGEQGPQGEQGAQGPAGADGQDGISAYQVWLNQGHVGSESDFLASFNGTDGKSAYQTWLDVGHVGTESDFLQWLKAPPQGKKTTQLNTADPLAGTEKIMLVQNNVSRVLTLDELKTFLNS